MSDERPTTRPGLTEVDRVAEERPPREVAYWALIRAMWNDDHPERGVWIADATVAERWGVSEATVRRTRQALEDAGFLHVEDQGHRQSKRKWATVPGGVTDRDGRPERASDAHGHHDWKVGDAPCGFPIYVGWNQHGCFVRTEINGQREYQALDDLSRDDARALDLDEAMRRLDPAVKKAGRGIWNYGKWKRNKSNRTGGMKTIDDGSDGEAMAAAAGGDGWTTIG